MVTPLRPPTVTRTCHWCHKPFQASARAVKAYYCSNTHKVEMRKKRYREKCPPTGPLRWSDSEIAFLKENYRLLGAKGVASALNRGWLGVKHKAHLVCAISKRWTHDDFQYLRKHYPVDGLASVAKALKRGLATTYEMAQKLNLPSPPRKVKPLPTITARTVIARVAAECRVTTYDILSVSKRRPVCRARWLVMRSLRDRKYSLSKIGQCLGLDHTTVISGLRRHAQIMAQQQAGAAE